MLKIQQANIEPWLQRPGTIEEEETAEMPPTAEPGLDPTLPGRGWRPCCTPAPRHCRSVVVPAVPAKGPLPPSIIPLAPHSPCYGLSPYPPHSDRSTKKSCTASRHPPAVRAACSHPLGSLLDVSDPRDSGSRGAELVGARGGRRCSQQVSRGGLSAAPTKLQVEKRKAPKICQAWIDLNP